MGTHRNKTLRKLRGYRDKLIREKVDLQTKLDECYLRINEARWAIEDGELLRAVALLSHDSGWYGDTHVIGGRWQEQLPEHIEEKKHLVSELSLVYKMMVIQQELTNELTKAIDCRDYLRAAALCADHKERALAHDKILDGWQKEGKGFVNILRKEINEEKGKT